MKHIQILGASTHAKRSHAGNLGHAHATLLLTMEGGVARVTINLDDRDGQADFRLKKDEAVELIRGLAAIYEIDLQVKGESHVQP